MSALRIPMSVSMGYGPEDEWMAPIHDLSSAALREMLEERDPFDPLKRSSFTRRNHQRRQAPYPSLAQLQRHSLRFSRRVWLQLQRRGEVR